MMSLKNVIFCSLLGLLLAVVQQSGRVDAVAMSGTEVEAETTIHKAWYGGYVGEFDVTVNDTADSWEAIIKFPRKVYDLEVSNAEIMHVHNRLVYRVRSNCNGNWTAGDNVHAFFYANTFRKTKGLIAEVRLTPLLNSY